MEKVFPVREIIQQLTLFLKGAPPSRARLCTARNSALFDKKRGIDQSGDIINRGLRYYESNTVGRGHRNLPYYFN
jgi:hypothetical protein